MPVLRDLPQRVQDRPVPADARCGPREEGQEGHDGRRLGGAHVLRGDMRRVLELRVATGAVTFLHNLCFKRQEGVEMEPFKHRAASDRCACRFMVQVVLWNIQCG